MWTLFWIIITFLATATIVDRIDMRSRELRLNFAEIMHKLNRLDSLIDHLSKLENK